MSPQEYGNSQILLLADTPSHTKDPMAATDAPLSPRQTESRPLEAYLELMADRRASDLFLSEGRAPAYRIDGQIIAAPYAPLGRPEMNAFLGKVLRTTQLEQLEKDGDLDTGLSFPRLGRFRLNIHLQRGLLGMVIRRVPTGQLRFEALGLNPAVKLLAEQPRGLILITGSTGSGKSTTLAAILHHINSTAARHIVTIEDPIEFVHDDIKSLITQREIGSDTRDFASALRHVVRESPDVIMIGEMRDAETMNVALSAAMTGHLVISTLHTTTASQTLQRIFAYYPEYQRQQVAMDLSLALQGILAQRLVPRDNGTGRVVAMEVLLGTPPMRKLIREQRMEEIEDLMNNSEGMITFNRALCTLFEQRVISLETGASYASNPEEFKLMAKGMERGSAVFMAEADSLPSVGTIDIRQLLQVALQYSASDVHLNVGTPPLLRVNGRLGPLGREKLNHADVRRMLFGLLSNNQREQFELERELDFAVTLSQRHRFRVNAHYQRNTVAVSMRLIPNTIPDMTTLGLPPVIKEIANKPHGLILVTGPTGSGKSTTLAAMVDQINQTRNCHIITIEDPIEFFHQNKSATVEQREVGADTKSFNAALKYILRQDPDVILVGEMRDAETIAAALTAAETGHLVMATLHTNDAPQTIDRIVDVFPPHQQPQVRSQLASALLAVLSQRLLVKADGQGRIPAFELLIGTPAVRATIREGKTHQLVSTMETSRKDGMITIDRCLIDLLRDKKISQEEALRNARVATALMEAQSPAPSGMIRR